MKTKEKMMEEAFALLENAAAHGERCPMNDQLPSGHWIMPALARAGWIRTEIYTANFRVVTILRGEHAGKKTAPPPGPARRPYKTVDRYTAPGGGYTDRPMAHADTAVRQPSKPRALTRDELK